MRPGIDGRVEEDDGDASVGSGAALKMHKCLGRTEAPQDSVSTHFVGSAAGEMGALAG